MTIKTYIAAELEPVTAHPDVTGKLHLTREDAIEANFQHDFCIAVANVMKPDVGWLETLPSASAAHYVRKFIETYPDMARIIAGDRDFT